MQGRRSTRRRDLGLRSFHIYAKQRSANGPPGRILHARYLYPHRPGPPHLYHHRQPTGSKDLMNYYSLNNISPITSFKEATIRGQAPDKGLYFPETIPAVPADLLKNIDSLSRAELAFRVIRPYV